MERKVNGADSGGFQELWSRQLPRRRVRARLFRHHCGLEVLSLESQERENWFAAGFSTTPTDDSGVAHIVEHVVLGGSQRYPVKDPFMEMVKTSMASFINAMTYPDHTVYPVASSNRRDFFNLVDVYWDAIFHPHLSTDGLRQEGWHYELSRPGDLASPLCVNGIVFNEMRAVAAELNSLIDQELNRALLPDTPRAFDAGGRPEAISTLSDQAFIDFYRQHYHPSQARVCFWGNIPSEEKLAYLSQLLADMPAVAALHTAKPPPPPPRPRQRRWTAPRRQRVAFAPEFSDGQSDQAGAWVMACFLHDELDPLLDLAFDLLDYLLLGDAAAPLQKALLESGLGDGLGDCGYDNESIETIFRVCVTGCPPENFPALERVVRDCLRAQVQQGFGPPKLQTALRQFRREQQEIVDDHCLSLFEDVFSSWMHGGDPLLYVDNTATLDALAATLAARPRFLEELLEQQVLNNPHTLYLELLPEASLQAQRQAEEQARLSAIRAVLGEEELRRLDAAAAALKARQEAPNRPEDLARLPRLCREDLPQEPPPFPCRRELLRTGLTLLQPELFSNGVTYLDLAYPLSAFSVEMLPVLPFYFHLVTRVGAAGRGYDAMAEKLAAATASIHYRPFIGQDVRSGQSELGGYVIVRLSALEECLPEALALFQDRLRLTHFDERKRCQELLRQNWSQIRDGLLENGQGVAVTRAAAGLSPLSSLNESWRGVEYAAAAKKNARDFGGGFAALQKQCQEIQKLLAAQAPLAAAYVGADSGLAACRDFLHSCGSVSSPAALSLPPYAGNSATGRQEALLVNGGVAFCARVMPAPLASSPAAMALHAYAHTLSCGKLWDEIRVKGGAYGAQCAYDGNLGLLQLSSNSDPQPARSFAIFSALAQNGFRCDNEDVHAAIIAGVKADERPLRPPRAGAQALWRELFGWDEERRRELRRRLFALTPELVEQCAGEFWQQFATQANDCLVAPGSLSSALHYRKLVV
jgi:Zn-dependent M16 (insulinase) family peptidase